MIGAHRANPHGVGTPTRPVRGPAGWRATKPALVRSVVLPARAGDARAGGVEADARDLHVDVARRWRRSSSTCPCRPCPRASAARRPAARRAARPRRARTRPSPSSRSPCRATCRGRRPTCTGVRAIVLPASMICLTASGASSGGSATPLASALALLDRWRRPPRCPAGRAGPPAWRAVGAGPGSQPRIGERRVRRRDRALARHRLRRTFGRIPSGSGGSASAPRSAGATSGSRWRPPPRPARARPGRRRRARGSRRRGQQPQVVKARATRRIHLGWRDRVERT